MAFTNEQRTKGGLATKEKKLEESYQYFLNNPNERYNSERLKRSLLRSAIPYCCKECGISDWKGKEISLEVDHIDGNNYNNALTNLQFLCPNCHSQTETWRGRGMNTGRKKVSDEELLEHLKREKSIRQALIAAKLTPKGGNYKRAYDLLYADSNGSVVE